MSKSKDAVASISDGEKGEADVEAMEPARDHGSLLGGAPDTKLTKVSSKQTPPKKPRQAFSPGGGRPVPKARTFLEDSDEPKSDPAKLRGLENSAPVPLLGQPSYLANGIGGIGGETDIEELREDCNYALGRRSGTKASTRNPRRRFHFTRRMRT